MKKKVLRAKDDTRQEYDQYFNIIRDIYNPMTTYRTRKAIALTRNERGIALSIGVASLSEAQELKKAGFNVTVCDISESAVEFARNEGFDAFQCDILDGSPAGKYDYIFCMEVLEHTANPLKAILNLKESLKEDGYLVISLPNEFNIISRIQMLFGYPPFGGHDWPHLRLFNREMGERLLVEAGLEIIRRDYCPRVPLWNRFSIIIGELLMRLHPSIPRYGF